MLKLLACINILIGFLAICCAAYNIRPIFYESVFNSQLDFLGLPSDTDIQNEPFVKIGNGYYYFENSSVANWFQAFEECRRMNAALVSFETLAEWNSIVSYRKLVNDENRYWTSGTDLGSEGKHVWMATGMPIAINVWTPDNPNNYANEEHCDELGWKGNSPLDGLNDLDCKAKLNYICEFSPPRTRTDLFVICERPTGFF